MRRRPLIVDLDNVTPKIRRSTPPDFRKRLVFFAHFLDVIGHGLRDLGALPLGQQRCTAAHFADGLPNRDHVPSTLLGDGRSAQAYCQVSFQASLRRCRPSRTPANECDVQGETIGVPCRT